MAGSRVGLFDNFNILGNSRTTSTENCARLSKSERMRGRKRGVKSGPGSGLCSGSRGGTQPFLDPARATRCARRNETRGCIND